MGEGRERQSEEWERVKGKRGEIDSEKRVGDSEKRGRDSEKRVRAEKRNSGKSMYLEYSCV